MKTECLFGVTLEQRMAVNDWIETSRLVIRISHSIEMVRHRTRVFILISYFKKQFPCQSKHRLSSERRTADCLNRSTGTSRQGEGHEEEEEEGEDEEWNKKADSCNGNDLIMREFMRNRSWMAFRKRSEQQQQQWQQ